ncbi:FtsX-like permease family protein [Cryptosporangium phraense]|uniref:FtsX-like permease family protein n=1 Tax=Cryptosporangium phraense TaxID=2593070 RepID=A0A545AQ89_9ACTN|nr:FtsX-like permease family protein [Cryptosporangium phraense]TQS43492.1 FtsX-like permease family protein [Cryptosporangium phraense]
MIRLPAVHWPSVRGRARADAGPLTLVAGVVLVVTMLAAAVPPLMGATADDAAQDAIRRAGPDAAVQVESRWPDDYGNYGGRIRNDKLATDVDDFRGQAKDALDPELRAALGAPVLTATSVSLLVTDGSIQRRFQLDYVQTDRGGPDVTWVAGRAPRGTVAGTVETPDAGPPWEAQVGLSEADAAALKVRPGDHVPVEDDQRNPYNVLVSGIFRPVDPKDPAWQVVPWLLRPATGLDGAGSTRLGGMLSAESLPDGRLALLPDQLVRTVWYQADPDRLTWESAQRLAATVVALKASSGSSAQRDTSLKWNTQLDGVLGHVREQVDAAYASASVLVIAVLAGAALVLLLAADLLGRRRAGALITARRRGAGLPDVATELVVESVLVAVPAFLAGLALSGLLAGGAALRWAPWVVLCAVVAGPVFGTLTAARATSDRRRPANRSARGWQQRTRQLRRTAIDVAVLAAAAAALVALRQRGVGDSALPASAPTLGVVAGALLLLRLVPAGIRLALRQALRSRRALAVFGAARAGATAGRALPLLALTTTVALAAFAATLQTTASHGMTDGSWRTVGADARLDLPAGAATPVGQIAAAPGVTQVAAAQVEDTVSVIADGQAVTPSLMTVQAARLESLLAHNPLPDAPQLARLRPSGNRIPVLVRSHDGSLRPGMSMRLLRGAAPALELEAVGVAPDVGDAPDLIMIDAGPGRPFVPNTVWVNGPGAARAVVGAAVGGRTFVRADVVHDLRTAPLNAGLVTLDRAAAGALLVLGLLGFALSAAASAPERWTTLARLRTLGLRPRDAQRVAAAELLPPLLVAAVCGPLLGLLLVRLTFDALALRTLTGQAGDPPTVVPWWLLGTAVVVLLGALVAVVAAEAAARHTHRLGDVLRVGSPG